MPIKKIIYHHSILNLFDFEIEKFGIIETGGVLLGKTEKECIYISKAIGSGPKAIHEDIYFRADSNYIDMMIDIEYANSNGEISYIGEWHTHPQIHPEPSYKDLQSLSEITESSGKENLLLIIGAINYQKSKFINQSISIIKNPERTNFYLPDVLVSNEFK